MAAMPRDPQTDADWNAEADEQAKIAEQIESDAPVKSTPQVAGTDAPEETTVDEVVEAQPLVTIHPVGDDIEYPLTVSVVGAVSDERPDGIVFQSAGDSIEVEPQVAEQVTYLPNVEVAE